MPYSVISDNEISSNVASVSASLISKIAYNNEGTAAGDTGAPRLLIDAISSSAPTAGNAIIREWRSDSGQFVWYSTSSPVPALSTRINRTGTYRTQIRVDATGSTAPTLRVYRNGSAYGTSRTVTVGNTGTFTEDLSFTKGDFLQFMVQNIDTSFSKIYFYIAVSVPLRPIAKSL